MKKKIQSAQNIAVVFTDGSIHISSTITEQIDLASDLIRR